MAAEYWIVGPGRLGLSLAAMLVDQEVPADVVLVGRRERPPTHPIVAAGRARYRAGISEPPGAGARVIVAVPDSAIRDVASELAAAGEPGGACVALHLSGALDARELGPLAARGYRTGSLHPLQTVADPESGPERLRGSFFSFEGDPEAGDVAREIVEVAGGELLRLPKGDKGRYHAACVFASNYLVTCAAVATRLLSSATGVEKEDAARALAPLWRGSIANLEAVGLPGALTGPVIRGDLKTVRANLAALDGADRELYRQLGLQALELGLQAGLAEDRAAELAETLRGHGSHRGEGE